MLKSTPAIAASSCIVAIHIGQQLRRPRPRAGGWASKGAAAAGKPRVEGQPRVQRFARPDPKTRGNANDEAHDVLEENQRETGLARGANLRLLGLVAANARQRLLPTGAVEVLVDVHSQDDALRDNVEERGEANLDHQLLQGVRLDANRLDALANRPADAKEGDKTGDEEERANGDGHHEGRDHKEQQIGTALVAHRADARKRVAVDGAQTEDDHRLAGGQEPGEQVKVLRVTGDRLAAPLQTGRQEPGEREDEPPVGGGHAEEVQQNEADQTAGRRRSGPLVANDRAVAGDGRVAETHSQQVPAGDAHVTSRQEDYGPLGVAEALRVDQIGEKGQRTGDHGDDGGHVQPPETVLAIRLGKVVRAAIAGGGAGRCQAAGRLNARVVEVAGRVDGSGKLGSSRSGQLLLLIIRCPTV